MPTNSTTFRKCSVPDCQKPVKIRGYCVQHYTRWLRHGSTSVNLRDGIPTVDRFWMKVNKNGPNGCWLWIAHKNKAGYGRLHARNTYIDLAHRFAYEQIKGPIPEGFTLDHLCRNRACVNPAHLEPVTRKDNVLRGIGHAAQNAKKTHCLRGHPFDLFNTSYGPDGDRTCRKCGALRKRTYRATTSAKDGYNR